MTDQEIDKLSDAIAAKLAPLINKPKTLQGLYAEMEKEAKPLGMSWEDHWAAHPERFPRAPKKRGRPRKFGTGDGL